MLQSAVVGASAQQTAPIQLVAVETAKQVVLKVATEKVPEALFTAERLVNKLRFSTFPKWVRETQLFANAPRSIRSLNGFKALAKVRMASL
ncbi:MAG: hypothetical protein HGA31_00260 [Candidatus Moranbacteria bacterium]|nr:hypothetical protein [Candidatus Moranbacteria bacterium]